MPPDWEVVFAIFRQKLYDVTAHAEEKLAERDIAHAEIEQAMTHPILLEDYPTDKYGPSCLVLGFTAKDRPNPCCSGISTGGENHHRLCSFSRRMGVGL